LLNQFDLASSHNKDGHADEKLLSQWTLKPLVQKEPTSSMARTSANNICKMDDNPPDAPAPSSEIGVGFSELSRKSRFVLEAISDDGLSKGEISVSKQDYKVPCATSPSDQTVPVGFVESIFCDKVEPEIMHETRKPRLTCPHGNCFLCSKCSAETMTPNTEPPRQAEHADSSKEFNQTDPVDRLILALRHGKFRDSADSAAQPPSIKVGDGSRKNSPDHTPRIAASKSAHAVNTTVAPTALDTPHRRNYYLEASPEPCAAPPRQTKALSEQNALPPEWFPPSLMPEAFDSMVEEAMDVTLQRPGVDEEELQKSLDPGLPSLELQHRVAELLEERRRNDEIQLLSSAPTESVAPSLSQVKTDEESAGWIDFIESRKPIPLGALPSLNENLPPSSVASGAGPRTCPRPPMLAAAEAALAFPWRSGTKSLLYGCDRVQTFPNFKTGEAKPLKALPPGPLMPSGPSAKQTTFLPSSKALKACGAEPLQMSRAGRRTESLPSIPFGFPETPTGKIVVGAFSESTEKLPRPVSAKRSNSLSAVAGIPKHVRSSGTQSRRVTFDPTA